VAEEAEGREHGSAVACPGVDPVAVSLALSAVAQSERVAAKAEAFLEKQGALSDRQSRLADLQIDSLAKQDEYELSHLRWRRFNDQMRGVGYAILMLTGVTLVAVIGAAVLAAASDNGLVVESFSVPADFSERGQSGAAVAQHVLDRIAALQSQTVSVRAASSYSNNWGDDLKVQIPDTGVSLGEAYGYLVRWLGHQTRITGEIVRSDKGFAVTARAGSVAAHTFTGGDLDTLLDKAAESIFADTQPYLYGVYLTSHDRNAESRAVLSALARSNASPSERAWAYSGLIYGNSDDPSAEQWGRAAVALDPSLMLAHNNLSATAVRFGHSELGYHEALAAVKLGESGADRALEPHAADVQKRVIGEEAYAAVGDYRDAIREVYSDLATDWSSPRGRSMGLLVRDLAADHDLRSAKAMLPHIPPVPDNDSGAAKRQILAIYLAQAQIDAEAQDWAAANRDVKAGVTALYKSRTSMTLLAQLPLARAKSGDITAARSLGSTLPADCYPCVEARANVETEAHDWPRAATLFADAVEQAPSIPFAYLDWGRMLMAKGDYNGAIAKFAEANQKGPHFADPLEMWGEALMLKGRSDLALAKFEEANKYAPNWGRLHLKGGEALFYAGRKDEARKQFAIAANLDLSVSDKTSLARWMTPHG
jgi:tetratricopeptide (TPR) repeat protein